MKRFLILMIVGFSCMTNIHARKTYDREIKSTLFIPKGSWNSGITVSYGELDAKNYKLLILDDVKGEGYTFKISPHASYFFRNDLAVGLRADYKRSYIDLGSINLDLGDDLSFDIKDYSYLSHGVNTSLYLRSYTSLGKSKVFAFFAEGALTYGYSQGKTISGSGDDMTGTFQTRNHFQIGVTPGLTAFVTNNIAVEVSVDVLGLDFQWINQKTNQVETGSFRTSAANFNINLFSINLGICSYF